MEREEIMQKVQDIIDREKHGLDTELHWQPMETPPEKSGNYLTILHGILTITPYDRERNIWNVKPGKKATHAMEGKSFSWWAEVQTPRREMDGL